MGEAAGEERMPPPGTDLRRRFWVTWGLVFALILLAFATTVIVLNSTLYSSSGFVRSYLGALARHDGEEAAGMPGVELPDGVESDLLDVEALTVLDDVRLVSEVDEGAGTHRVTFEFTLDGTEGSTEFLVEKVGTRLGLFNRWQFALSPAAVLEITPVNEAQFDANGISIQSSGGPSVPVRYGVLTPGAFALEHRSELLVADRESILTLEPGSTTEASVRTRATEQFVALVQQELNRALDECTEQEVLQPSGCPFGEVITNRVDGVPEWSIAEYPTVTIVPGRDAGTWQVPETAGAAHLVVGVRSLFDGTRSTFDEDIPFTVGYLITLQPGGGIRIDAR